MLLAVALTVASISVVAYADTERLDKNRIISQVADNWIAVAQKQYEKSMYTQARKSLTRARQYYQYLDPKQKDSIDTLINKTQNAMLKKKQLLEQIDVADELAEQGKLLKAKAHLEQVLDSKMLNIAEKQRMTAALRRIDAQLDMRRQQIKELFERSRQYYISGEFEKARQGFAKVAESGLYVPPKGMTAEQYLQEINESGMADVSPVVKAAESRPESKLWFWDKDKDKESKSKETDKTKLVDVAEPVNEAEPKPNETAEPWANKYQSARPQVDAEGSGESNIKHSYVKAVVGDARKKVARRLGSGEFGEAKIAVENARLIIERYRSDISPEFFRRLTAELDGLSRMILRQQGEWPY